MIHDFWEQIEYSLLPCDEPFWTAVYEEAFPDMVDLKTVSDLHKQKLGIDRVITLGNGKRFFVDEKKRKRTYPDILLEYVAVNTTGAPGWMEKNLAIDYIAYAFMPTKTVYLIPWDSLKMAWKRNKGRWMVIYKDVEGKNEGYITHSIAVPIEVLKNEVDSIVVVKLPLDKWDNML